MTERSSDTVSELVTEAPGVAGGDESVVKSRRCNLPICNFSWIKWIYSTNFLKPDIRFKGVRA